MPYADPEKRRAAKRAYHARRYREDAEFRSATIQRASAWYSENADAAIARVYEYRAQKRADAARARSIIAEIEALISRATSSKVSPQKLLRAKTIIERELELELIAA